MAGAVDIANLALGRIGHSKRLAALTDPGLAAECCASLYPVVRDRLLQQYDWQWAETCVALAVSTASVPGWRYAYAYPERCLRLTAVCDAAGARLYTRPIVWRDGRQYVYPPNEPYRVFHSGDDEDSAVITTDVVEAYAVYVRRVEVVDRYPPLFYDAVAWALAMELSLVLETDPKLATFAQQMAQSTLMDAAAASANESLDDPEPDSPSIRARG